MQESMNKRKMTQLAPWLLPIVLMAELAGCASAPDPKPAQEMEQEMAQQEAMRIAASKALEQADKDLQAAQALGWDAGSAESVLKRADDAFAKGMFETARDMALQVSNLATTGLNARQMLLARQAVDQASRLTRLNQAQLDELMDIRQIMGTGNGRLAYEKATRLLTTLVQAQIDYRVVKGDSLWGISGKPDIYDNPYQWPLIYKANKHQINDADLIFPGQEFEIESHPDTGEVDAAIDHARNRGAWSLGDGEASDKVYLER